MSYYVKFNNSTSPRLSQIGAVLDYFDTHVTTPEAAIIVITQDGSGIKRDIPAVTWLRRMRRC